MRRTALLSCAAAAVLALPASASALTVSKAQLSGGQLRVEGTGAGAGAFVTASSTTSAAGARVTDPKSGAFKMQADGFRAGDCTITVYDNRTPSATVRLAGCTPVAPQPNPTTPTAPSGTCAIDPVTPASVHAGDLSAVFFSTTGCTGGPLQWRVVAGQVPPGFDPPTFQGQTGGSIGGRATVEGSYTFTVGVTDGAGQTDTETATVTVTAPRAVSIVNANALPSALLGQSYQVNLSADGGVPGYTWRLAGGTLPPGLSLFDSTAVPSVAGHPTARGTYTFSVAATDSRGAVGTKTFTLTVS